MVIKLRDKKKDENIEEVIPEQILNNLAPNEEILFKLRTKKISKLSRAFNIIMVECHGNKSIFQIFI